MIKIVVYIDIIFLENLIMNSIILYASSIILKIKPKILRILLSSTLGSIYSIIIYITKIKLYNLAISKILLSVIMVYIAFDAQNIKKLWKQILIFYLTSFIFGGVALYLIYFIKPQQINNMVKTIFLGGIVGIALIKIAFRLIKTKLTANDMYCNIKVKLKNKSIQTKAMIDTGNLVKEPITNAPVIIVERNSLYEIIPKEILNNLDNIINGNLNNIPEEMQNEYIAKLKWIPFKSLGRENGIILGIKVDEVEIAKEEEKKKFENSIIGIYDKSLTKRGEYCALVGIEML